MQRHVLPQPQLLRAGRCRQTELLQGRFALFPGGAISRGDKRIGQCLAAVHEGGVYQPEKRRTPFFVALDISRNGFPAKQHDLAINLRRRNKALRRNINHVLHLSVKLHLNGNGPVLF